MIFQHTVLAAEMSGAEGAVANYALGGLFAVGECAADFFGHSRGEVGGLGDGWRCGDIVV